MNIKQTKYELQNILSGKSSSSHDALIQAATRYLGGASSTGPMAKEKHQNKDEETKKLIAFASQHNLFLDNIDEDKFVSSGAEQKVYIQNHEVVIKLNDAIYYASWQDYFYNLLLHNYFFSETAYQFKGFYKNENTLYAVVQQSTIKADALTDLLQVQEFLNSNGFTNTKNHDYYHPELGIILEDLHDENVLTRQNMLFFIDTVFYIKPEVFWRESPAG